MYAPGGGKRISSVDRAWRVNKLKVATFDVDFKGNESPAGLFSGVGTSYAAPLVSGFVSLLLSHNPALTPADFIKQLLKFSRPVNPSPTALIAFHVDWQWRQYRKFNSLCIIISQAFLGVFFWISI